MDNYFLSDEAYTALIGFFHGDVPDVSDDVIDYLIDQGFLTVDPPDIIPGDGPGIDDIKVVDRPPRISERGKGFICAMREYESRLKEFHRLAESSERSAAQAEAISAASETNAAQSVRIADSAEKISRIAERKARKADIKSWIAISVSILTAFFEFAINHEQITGFIQGLIT